jgi:hypothetical protein
MGVVLVIALTALPGARTAAQSLDEGLHRCAAERSDAKRLACYDRLEAAARPAATATLPVASAATPVATTTPAPVPAAATAAAPARDAAAAAQEFGVSEGPLAARRQAANPHAITAVVTRVATRPRGELVVTLDNGQVWTQLQAVDYFPLSAGDRITISTGALGSYVLEAPSRRSTKVTRLQ